VDDVKNATLVIVATIAWSLVVGARTIVRIS
jgi:hypothetical protein